jgi:hypothetical protein
VIAETLEKEQKQQGLKKEEGETQQAKEPGGSTFIHHIFEGILTNETKCLSCESVTSRDESFLDLSVDIDQNTSISSSLRNFSKMGKNWRIYFTDKIKKCFVAKKSSFVIHVTANKKQKEGKRNLFSWHQFFVVLKLRSYQTL